MLEIECSLKCKQLLIDQKIIKVFIFWKKKETIVLEDEKL